MSKLLDKAVSIAASASAVASYLKKKLAERDDTPQIVELYSNEEAAKKHAEEVAEDSYIEMTDDSEDTTIINYAPRTVAAGVPLVMEQVVAIDNDTDDVEALMFNYPLEFEEEEAKPAPETVIQAEPDYIPEDKEAEDEIASDGYDTYEENDEESEVIEENDEDEEEFEEDADEEVTEDEAAKEVIEEDMDEAEELEEEDEEEEDQEEEIFEEESEEDEDDPDFTDVEEAEDEETSLERKLEDRISQAGGIGYKAGIKDAPVEEDIIEPNVDAIMAATRVADETIEEIVHDIENETISAADIDRELGRDPFEKMNIEVVNNPMFNNPSYQPVEPDIDMKNFIDEAVSSDMNDSSFIDNIDNDADQLADLTRKVVELSSVGYPENLDEPAPVQETSSVENVLNDNTENLFQEINSLSLSDLSDQPITIVKSEPAVEVKPKPQAKPYPHLTERRISKIREQLDAMLTALGGVDKIYLKHYATFSGYGSYWNFKKDAEGFGYEVTDMNDKNEAFMYKEYDADKNLLLQDILTLADSVAANQGNYQGWGVVDRSN